MMRLLSLMLFFCSLMSWASEEEQFGLSKQSYDLLTSVYKSASLDLNDHDWIAVNASHDSIYLTNMKRKSFAVVTEYVSELSVAEAENYFASNFSKDFRKHRKKEFKTLGADLLGLEAGSDTLNGVRYGGTAFRIMMGEMGKGHFYERLWAEKGRMWQISLVSFEEARSSDFFHGELNHLMKKVMEAPVKTTDFWSFIMSNAYAQQDCVIAPNAPLRDLERIIPAALRARGCANVRIARERMDNPPRKGIKVINGQFWRSCAGAPRQVLSRMWNGIVQGLREQGRQVDDEFKRLRCMERWESARRQIGVALANQMLRDCAGVANGVVIGRAVSQIARAAWRGTVSLYNWLRAGNNPFNAALAYLSRNVEGFLCLSAAEQGNAVCSFVTQMAGTAVVVAGVVVSRGGTLSASLFGLRAMLAAPRAIVGAGRGAIRAGTNLVVRGRDGGNGGRGPASVNPRGQQNGRVASAPVRTQTAAQLRSEREAAERARQARIAQDRANAERARIRREAAETRRRQLAEQNERETSRTRDLNSMSYPEQQRALFDANLRQLGPDVEASYARIDEIGIDEFLDEAGPNLSAPQRLRLLEMYRALDPSTRRNTDGAEGEAPLMANSTGISPEVPAVPRPTATVRGINWNTVQPEQRAQLEASSRLDPADPAPRLQQSRLLLGRDLNPDQENAIMAAHRVGHRPGDAPGAGYFNYSPDEILEKGNILRNAGFSGTEIRMLMERGLTGRIPDGSRELPPVLDFNETRSLAVSTRTDAGTIRDRISRGTEVNSTDENVLRVQENYRSVARGYEAEGTRLNSAEHTGASARFYVQSGDADSALRAYRRGIESQNMNADAIINGNRGINQRLREIDNELTSSPNNPLLITERNTLRRIRTELTPSPVAPVTLARTTDSSNNTSSPEPERNPAGSSDTNREERSAEDQLDETISGLTPSQASIQAERLAFDNQHNEAALYFERASAAPSFGDRNFRSAISQSLKGDGSLAADHMRAALDGGTISATNYVQQFYMSGMWRGLNPVQKQNLRNMIEEMRERGIQQILPFTNTNHRDQLSEIYRSVGGTDPLIPAMPIVSGIARVPRADVSLSAGSRQHLSHHLRFTPAQRARVDSAVDAFRNRRIGNAEDARRLVSGENSPFRKFRDTGIFPPGTTPDEVIAALRQGNGNGISSRRVRHADHNYEQFELEFRGSRYKVTVCNEPRGCRYSDGTVLQRNEVRTVFPKCGPGVMTAVPRERAIQLLTGPAPVTAESLIRATPCN